jgi:hypothetical protein
LVDWATFTITIIIKGMQRIVAKIIINLEVIDFPLIYLQFFS